MSKNKNAIKVDKKKRVIISFQVTREEADAITYQAVKLNKESVSDLIRGALLPIISVEARDMAHIRNNNIKPH